MQSVQSIVSYESHMQMTNEPWRTAQGSAILPTIRASGRNPDKVRLACQAEAARLAESSIMYVKSAGVLLFGLGSYGTCLVPGYAASLPRLSDDRIIGRLLSVQRGVLAVAQQLDP